MGLFRCISLPLMGLGQQPITGIQITYESIDDDSQNYSSPGGGTSDFGAGTTYQHHFNTGPLNNMRITAFDVGTNNFIFRQLSEQINIVRVDNSVITGEHHVILYELDEVAGTNIFLRSSRVMTMEETLLSEMVNRGADNVFANTGDGNQNNNNIERIDFIFGIAQPAFGDLGARGFLILDRGGNDDFQVAAILGVDENNFPTSFSDSVRVLRTDWGVTGLAVDSVVYRGYDGNFVPSANVTPQNLAGVFVNWLDLNIPSNTLVYGYSLVANDVPETTSWLDVENFPLDTNPDSDGGGLDLMSGGALVLDEVRNAVIGDFAWNDLNMDGIQDPGEPGVPGVEIRVYDLQTNLAGVAVTDANGAYVIFGLPSDLYFMEVTPPPDWQFSPQMVGPDASVYSIIDPATGRSPIFGLDISETNFNFDVGLFLPPTDLGVTKTVDQSNPTVGDTVEFVIQVDNVGPENTTQVHVEDLLPAGLTFVSATPSQGTYDPVSGIWLIGDLDDGEDVSLILVATVDPGTGGQVITNEAAIVFQNRPDTNTANNVDSAVLTVQSADVALSKTVDNASPEELDAIVFTITVTNNGPSVVTSLEVLDALPTGLNFDFATPSQGTYDDTTGLWMVGTLGVGSNATLQLGAIVAVGTGGTTLTNVASWSDADQEDPVSDNNVATAVVTVVGADLSLTKVVNPQAPSENDEVIYTITVSNNGPSAVADVDVEDPLAAGLTFVSYSASQGTYNDLTGLWSLGSLGVNESAVLLLTAQVDVGTVNTAITNTATITNASVPDPDLSNNTDSAVIQVSGLRLFKSVSPTGTVEPGDTLTYTVVLTNVSASVHEDVDVIDFVPEGTTYVPDSLSIDFIPPQSSFSAPGTGGTVSLIEDDGTNYYVHVFTSAGSTNFVPPAGVTNVEVLVVGGGGGGGTSQAFESAGAGGGGAGGLIYVAQQAITGAVAVTVGTGGAGGVGPGHASGANGANSTFGDLVALGGGGGAGGNVSGNSGGSGGGSRGNDGGAATQPGSASGGFGNRGGNHASSPTSAAATGGGGADQAGADLAGVSEQDGGAGGDGRAYAISGSSQYYAGGGGGGSADSGPGSPGAGGLGGGGTGGRTGLPATEGAANTGGGGGGGNSDVDGADGGSGVVIVRYEAIEGDAPGELGVPPNLATGYRLMEEESLVLTFEVTVNDLIFQDEIVNVAQAISNLQPVPVEASVTNSLAFTDLAITKTVDILEPESDTDVVYSIVVTNNGPLATADIVVLEPLADGLDYVSHTVSQGTYDEGTGLWDLGSLAVNASATLTLTATVDGAFAGQNITNTATITAMNRADIDPSNNSDTVVITVAAADIGIVKSVDNSTPFAGADVVFTIVATNSGPSDATGVVVSDPLPVELIFVESTASAGSYDAGTGLWTVGALDQGAFETLTLTVTVASNTVGSVITNTASLDAVSPVDPNPENDTSSVTLEPRSTEELAITKDSDGGETILPNDEILYTIVVTNFSAFTHQDIVINDPIPTGTTYVASSSQIFLEQYVTNQFMDRFSSRLYSLQDGNQPWSADWVEDGEATSPIAGRIQVAFDPVRGQTYSLRIQGGGGSRSIYRTADLSTYSNAVLRLDYRRQNLAANSAPRIDVSANGGSGPWTTLATLSGPGTDSAYLQGVYDISAHMSTNTAIRFFENDMGGSSEYVWFDDVEILAERTEVVSQPGGFPPEMVNGLALPPSASLTLTFRVTVNPVPSDTNIVNIAQVTSLRQLIPLFAEVRDDIEFADLGVLKWVDDVMPQVDEMVTYTVELMNHGPFTASGIQILDLLPEGLAFESATPSVGSYDDNTGIWSIDSLSVSNGITLELTALATEDLAGLFVTNVAEVLRINQADLNPENNRDEAVIRVAPFFIIDYARFNDETGEAEVYHRYREGQVYDLLYVDAPSFSDSLSNQWALADRGPLDRLVDVGGEGRVPPNELPNGILRFYRISAPGFWEGSPRRASAEVAALNNVHLYPGQNWVRLWGNPYTNRIADAFRHALPQGAGFTDSTIISWYERAPFPQTRREEMFLADNGQEEGAEWRYSIHEQLFDQVADEEALPLTDGFIVELPEGQPLNRWTMVYALPTNEVVQTLPAGNTYNLVSPFSAESYHPSNLNLVGTGFTGGIHPVFSDWMWRFDREEQRAPRVIWYRTSDQTWRFTAPTTYPEVPANYFSPNDAIVIQTRRSPADVVWTNRPNYTPPNTRMNP